MTFDSDFDFDKRLKEIHWRSRYKIAYETCMKGKISNKDFAEICRIPEEKLGQQLECLNLLLKGIITNKAAANEFGVSEELMEELVDYIKGANPQDFEQSHEENETKAEHLERVKKENDFSNYSICREDEVNNIIEQIYLDGMLEGYKTAVYRFRLFDGLPLSSGDKYLNESGDKIKKILNAIYDNKGDDTNN